MQTSLHKVLICCGVAGLSILLSGCFGTVDDLGTFTFQLAANYEATFKDTHVPDTDLELIDLNDYQSFRENREKLQSARPYQIGWWVERIIPKVNTDNDVSNDIDVNEVVFDSVMFYIMFPDADNPNTPDRDTRFEVGRFENVKVADFILTPQVYEIEAPLAQTLSHLLLEHNRYYVETYFSEASAPLPEPPVEFTRIEVKADIVARLEADLDL